MILVSDSEEKKDEDEEKKTSGATGFDSTDSTETPPIKKSKTTIRSTCPYGATCYRKNPTHRTEQSHPGDSDYEDKDKDENESKTTTTNSDDKTVCPYGKSCYRKNPQHISDYQH